MTPHDTIREALTSALKDMHNNTSEQGKAARSNVAFALAALDELENPTEHMCDAARWFILARDANIHTWGGLTRCIPERPTIPYIEQKIKDDPTRHITKWDVAECIYRLMTQPPKEHE